MSALESLFSGYLTQDTRLLELKTALPDAALIVERFSGREALSEPFRFQIDCLSTHAWLDLDTLLGQEITLRLRQADGHLRHWHGYATHALQLGADGGLARYRLTMEPFLALLDRRRDCYLFQNKTVLDILGQIFADYPEANWSSQVTQPLRTHSLITQHRETDLALICRLLAEEHLSYRFTHDQTAAAGDEAAHARHQLILLDRDSPLPDNPQPLIRFHRSHATETSDTITTWQHTRTARPNAVALTGWDYKTLVATGAQADATLDNGQLPALQIHDASRPYRFQDNAAAQRHTDHLLAAHETRAQHFHGTGTVRQLAPGTTFTLSQHDNHPGEDGRFTLLAVDHIGANNLGAQAAQLLGHPDIEAGTYRNQFLAQPAARPILPLPLDKPVAQPQTALIVGLPGQALTTERDHRLKIQYPWQRGEAPNPGGLAAEAPGKSGHAPGNDQSGTWVRLGEWQAGPNWGSHHLPRLGTEVLITYLDGDIDRPLITGQHYNGTDRPPFSAGADAAANHPGVLSGWMSHNHQSGYNQWVIDDAPGQLRTRLASSENAGQLSLGHLIHQAPASAHRGAWRGSGFELATDAWLAVRAGEGLLLSTTARPDSHSTQLDNHETLGQLKAAAQTAQTLSEAAQAQGAAPLGANADQNKLLPNIDPQQDGKHPGSVGGQSATKPRAGSRQPGQTDPDPVERFAQPLILAEAPTDIGLATPASTLLFAASHLHATTQQDLHIAAAHTVAVCAGEDASWYCHSGGIRSIAQAGSHTLQAHTASLDILADQSITVTSSNEEVRLLAKQKIVLQAGQSSVTLEGQNMTFACPGTFSVRGSGQAFLGAGRGRVELDVLPQGLTNEQPHWIEVSHRDPEDMPMADQKYKIFFEGSQVIPGQLDSEGFAHHDNVPKQAIRVEYEPRTPDPESPWDALKQAVNAAQQKLA